jgi:hypothetical protein
VCVCTAGVRRQSGERDIRKGEREQREIEGGRERGRESEVVTVDWAM